MKKKYYYESKDGLKLVSSVGRDGISTIDSFRILTANVFISESNDIETNATNLVKSYYSSDYPHRVIETAENLNDNFIIKEFTPEMMKERRLTIMLRSQNEFTTNVVMSIKNLLMLIDVTSIADLDDIDTYVNQINQAVGRLEHDKKKEVKRRALIANE